jgi:hypothetical protein
MVARNYPENGRDAIVACNERIDNGQYKLKFSIENFRRFYMVNDHGYRPIFA